jgi:tight adherence protein B
MNGAWMLPAGAIALFFALLLLGMELTKPRVRRRRLASELGVTDPTTAAARFSALGGQATALAERALANCDREGRLGVALERAGVDLRPAEFAAMAGAVVVASVLVALLLFGVIVAIVVGVLVAVGFRAGVSWRGQKRRDRFEEQLGDSLQMISGGLRAGHSLPQSIDALVHEADSPTNEEFQRVLFETQLGHPLPQAMRNLAERVGSEDFEWVAEAVEIQRDVGGDLAELLDNVTDTIRDRRRVARQITTLTAEGRLSAVILFILPIAMFCFMAVANKAYFHDLSSTLAGNLLIAGAAVLMVVGGLWLRRIVRVQY